MSVVSDVATGRTGTPRPRSYAEAGVDVAAGEAAVERLAPLARATAGPGVVSGVGGFAGVFAPDAAGAAGELLVASTDGVGTKAEVAAALGRYDTIGLDLVAMCVDDVVCTGARPLFLLDYLVVGRLDPALVEAVVGGVAAGCRQAGAALLGGETAEHPGAFAPGHFDLAGFVVGSVDRRALRGAALVRAGDRLLGLASPGVRSNGYSLARAVLGDDPTALAGPAWPGAGATLGEELLRPSVLYAPAILAALADAKAGAGLHALAHVTGGGLAANLTRALPGDCDARVTLGSWPVPQIFGEIRAAGGVEDDEMARTFNCGLGMVAVVAPDVASQVASILAGEGIGVHDVGEVVPGAGTVRLEGAWNWPEAVRAGRAGSDGGDGAEGARADRQSGRGAPPS